MFVHIAQTHESKTRTATSLQLVNSVVALNLYAVGDKMQVVAATNSLPSGLGFCILNLWAISLLTRCLYRLYDGRKHVTVLD